MPAVRLVMGEDISPTIVINTSISPGMVWSYIRTSVLLFVMIGTWLIWFSAVLQVNVREDGIRAACLRAMPDQVERCFDTVMIQSGGGGQ